ncbi:MAG: hypothetical protein AB7R90_15505 [Reyranellaceae bacterium]
MPTRRAAMFSLVAALALPGLALAACGGGDDDAKPQLTSRGQQLIDLQRAYESGAISRRDYEREREKVLKEK